MNKNILVGVAAVVLVGGFVVASRVYRAEQAESVSTVVREQSKTLVPDGAPRLGDEAAKVVIVEFFDPACETCATFAPYVKKMVAQNPGKVQLVLRYAPFHAGSDTIVAALEASRRQDKYWETLDILFSTQAQWASHHQPQPERVWSLLEQGGVDVARLYGDMNDPAIQAIVTRDLKDAETLGVTKTPGFFVNGKPLVPFGLEPLTALVKSELQAAY